MQNTLLFTLFLSLLSGFLTAQTVTPHLTRGNQGALLAQQPTISFRNVSSSNGATISLNESRTLQPIDGFGFTLTQGSAQAIRTLSSFRRNQLMQKFFGTGGIANSMVRISIGASDLSNNTYTYNETNGDTNMNNFSLSGPDQQDLLPVLKQALQINPNLKVLATPWTAPTWMKEGDTSAEGYRGGSLQRRYYAAYALYFVRYLEAMRSEGIEIWGITPQNEPENPFNVPSMLMNANEQIDFINNHLGPQIRNAGFNTKIIGFDHNCNNTAYPTQVANSSGYVAGSAFHLYEGTIDAMSTVRNNTNKAVYFTEQYTDINGDFNGDLGWHMENVVVGSLNNWSQTVFSWNLASFPDSQPRTNGGCTDCLGAATIENGNYQLEVSYYIIGQVSKFIKAGARRIGSFNNNDELFSAAFRNPDGEQVVVAYNRDNGQQTVRVRAGSRSFDYNLPGRSAVTFVWTPGSGSGTPGNDTGLSGFYNIINRGTGRGLDVAGNSTTNNSNIHQWDISNGGGDNQRWEFEELNNGYYRIKVKHTGRCLSQYRDNQYNVVQQNCQNISRQQWDLQPVGSTEFFRVVNRVSGRRLQVDLNNGNNNGANVNTSTASSGWNRQWRFVQAEGGNNRQAQTQVLGVVGVLAEQVDFFPNPTDDKLTLKLPHQHDFSSARILDAAGRQLMDTPVNKETIRVELSLTKLPAGVYFIHFNSPTQPVVRRLIKN